jgi:hypothetical protein
MCAMNYMNNNPYTFHHKNGKKKPKIHSLKLPSAYQSNHEEKLYLNSDIQSINFHKSKIKSKVHRNLENVINI